MQLKILKMNVDLCSLNRVVNSILSWVKLNQSRYICVANTHMCMETFKNIQYLECVNSSDITVPDGRPLFWMQKLLRFDECQQVRGTDLTLEICKISSQKNISIGFYGSTNSVLRELKLSLKSKFDGLKISYLYSPPFRDLSDTEQSKIIEEIKNSKTQILFVGLGCPKQEIWMYQNKEKLKCTMIGVGAAFDFISGNKKDAPVFVQKIGLEWMFRLIVEPRRLWKRYLVNNSQFLFYSFLQLMGKKYV